MAHANACTLSFPCLPHAATRLDWYWITALKALEIIFSRELIQLDPQQRTSATNPMLLQKDHTR